MAPSVTIEICVDSLNSALAAQAGGASRIELCRDLQADGLTPSADLTTRVRHSLSIPIHVLIRPRAGDFAYTRDEFEVMKREIRLAQNLGADGVVLGILDSKQNVDLPRTRELVRLAQPLPVTFHRAFDAIPDRFRALDAVKETGARCILTSGGMLKAEEGLETLQDLVHQAGKDVAIMAAGGIRETNVAHIIRSAGVRQIHSSLQPELSTNANGHDASNMRSSVVSSEDVARFVRAASKDSG